MALSLPAAFILLMDLTRREGRVPPSVIAEETSDNWTIAEKSQTIKLFPMAEVKQIALTPYPPQEPLFPEKMLLIVIYHHIVSIYRRSQYLSIPICISIYKCIYISILSTVCVSIYCVDLFICLAVCHHMYLKIYLSISIYILYIIFILKGNSTLSINNDYVLSLC